MRNRESEKVFLERLSVAKIVLGDPKKIISVRTSKSETLKWVQSTWAGVDALFQDNEAPKSFSFALTRLGGCFGTLMGEYTFAYILARQRKLFEMKKFQEQSKWNEVEYKKLSSYVLGIVGFGEIGTEIARIASHGFGMRVLLLRRRHLVDPNCPYIVYSRENMKEFLSKVDYLVSILPSTHETRHMFSEDVLSNCKKGCYFINVGRGDVIDEKSLLNALDKQWISGAVLDVFEQEPLPESSPLWKHDRICITPHIAALTFAEDVANVFVDNLIRFSNVSPMRYVIDPSREY